LNRLLRACGYKRTERPENLKRKEQIQEDDFEKIVSKLSANDLYYVLRIPKMKGKEDIQREEEKTKYGVSTIMKTRFIPNEIDDSEKLKLINENIQIVDFDDLLLCSAMRYVEALDGGNVNVEDMGEVYKILLLIKKQLAVGAKLDCEYNGGKVHYSSRELEGVMKRWIVRGNEEPQYVSPKECREKKAKVIEGSQTLKDMSAREYALMEISPEEEIRILRENPENYVFFLKQQKIKYAKQKILNDIIAIGKCSSELFELLCRKTEITPDEICDLFEKGIITVEDLKTAREIKEIPIITAEILYERYEEYKMARGDQEKEGIARKKIERYALAYRQTELLGKTEEELEEKGNQFMEKKGDAIKQEDIIPLYALDIIPLNVAVDWGGENVLEELLAQEKLKPADAKYLKGKGFLTEALLMRIFDKFPDMSYAYQFAITIEIFEEEEVQERVAQHYHIGFGMVSKKRDEGDLTVEESNLGNENADEVIKGEKSVGTKLKSRPPSSKYKLLAAADKRKTIEEGIKDGHIIFHYPSLDGGTVVIEKMHKVIKNTKTGKVEIKTDDGLATYVMSEQEFIDIKGDLIKDGKVVRRQLSSRWLHKLGYWYMHYGERGWEDAMIERLKMNARNPMHTTEDLEEIEKRVKESIRSRQNSLISLIEER